MSLERKIAKQINLKIYRMDESALFLLKNIQCLLYYTTWLGIRKTKGVVI